MVAVTSNLGRIRHVFDRTTSTAGLAAMVGAVSSLTEATDDSERIDRIRLLEELKSAAAAAQAVETAAFAASRRAAQAAQGVPNERVGRGIAAEIGLARRISPYHAQRYTGWARILSTELPRTLAELRAGRTNEWRAMLVARETAWLSREHRAAVDADLGAAARGARRPAGRGRDEEAGLPDGPARLCRAPRAAPSPTDA